MKYINGKILTKALPYTGDLNAPVLNRKVYESQFRKLWVIDLNEIDTLEEHKGEELPIGFRPWQTRDHFCIVTFTKESKRAPLLCDFTADEYEALAR